MFFLIRVAFWLTIVFSAMAWPQDQRSDLSAPGLWPKALGMVGKVAEEVGAWGKKACVKTPLACLEAANNMRQIAADDRLQGKARASGVGLSPAH